LLDGGVLSKRFDVLGKKAKRKRHSWGGGEQVGLVKGHDKGGKKKVLMKKRRLIVAWPD